ncbi:hypothetical protein [Deinococcus roseus]|uniref:YdhG-like domain-containing protein n=1 Tax=Deinococcus roseus TaxID=392414 RepID=A0ABQ2D746_9DEIO|nr:hypothetical protein [Deinococcus roseus]GGJ48349.1 hypothetical protein GCM10008938_37970 [Deinococcus roseus]
MSTEEVFSQIYDRLKRILQKYEGPLGPHHSPSFSLDRDSYGLRDPHNPASVGFFGSVVVQGKHVGFYLMPIYLEPQLLKDISPALRKCLKGKSCFNFKTYNETLFEELERLTEVGFAYYEAFHLVVPETQP